MKQLLIFTLALSFTLSSCDKKLDIDPLASISEDLIFTSDANVKKALNGAYDAVSDADVYGGDLQLFAELLATESSNGEIRWDGTFNQPREIFNKQMLTNNSYITSSWVKIYAAINVCNNILANLAIVDDDDREQVQGEALFLRGSMYFELVKLFAKPYSAGTASPGVPLISTPTVGNISEVNYSPRSTVQQTYDFILSDLTTAKTLLPEENGVYATTYAASAQLSRVYLQMASYARARDEANIVIASNEFSLADNYSDAFNNESNSTEDIFAIQVNSQDGGNDMHLFWSTTSQGARNGDVDVLQKHLDIYDGVSVDDRYDFFYKDGSVWRSGKWRLQYRNLSIIRLAEMYLTRAESNFRLVTSIGATPQADIKMIRDRAGLQSIPLVITLQNILLERRRELAHEGQAIHDLKRVQGSVGAIPYNANNLVMPIPIREINAVGPAILQQNEGY